MSTPRLEAKPSLQRQAKSAMAVLDLDGGGGFDTGYTSLRDIVTSSSSSASGSFLLPSASTDPRAGEIQIRNRLVQQAAYAYLQPIPSSFESSRRQRRNVSLRRLIVVLSCGLAGFCFDFVGRFFPPTLPSLR